MIAPTFFEGTSSVNVGACIARPCKGYEFAGSFDKNTGFLCRAIDDRPYIL